MNEIQFELTQSHGRSELSSNISEFTQDQVVVDAFEALALAHFFAGFDITCSGYTGGIKTAIESIQDNMYTSIF